MIARSDFDVVAEEPAASMCVFPMRERVVMVGDERHPPHERPPLSKAVLSGEAAAESTWLQKPEAFSALALDWRPGARVTRIDRGAKALAIGDGESIRYDKLILCTGGRARPLAVPGADAVAVHTLRTIDDALRSKGRKLTVADLKEGPGHYPGTPLPGQAGNSAIAGHRTTYGAPFNRIDELVTFDALSAEHVDEYVTK